MSLEPGTYPGQAVQVNAFTPSMSAILLVLGVLLPAHAQSPITPAAMVIDLADLQTPEAIVAVPPQLDALLRDRVIEPTTSRDRRLNNLVDLLFGPQGLAIQYDGTRTRTIAESAAERKANCLSFSLMFVELARRAGIEAYVQETDHVLVWQGDGVLYGNGHVNVGVKIGLARKTVDIDRSVVSIRGVPRAISDRRALSHYYNNRGAELMQQGLLQAAHRHLEMAIRLTPDFVGAWNNLGVLNMRESLPREAEYAYRKVLEEKPRHAPALSNMVNLYRQVGDTTQRAEFEQRLFQVQRKDPFHQIILALSYENNRDYTAAIKHYQRAIRLKAREHFVYFGLARSYAHVGDMRRAVDALTRARDSAGDERDMYQAKLDRIGRWHPTAAR